jgi:hypothetical protein
MCRRDEQASRQLKSSISLHLWKRGVARRNEDVASRDEHAPAALGASNSFGSGGVGLEIEHGLAAVSDGMLLTGHVGASVVDVQAGLGLQVDAFKLGVDASWSPARSDVGTAVSAQGIVARVGVTGFAGKIASGAVAAGVAIVVGFVFFELANRND